MAVKKYERVKEFVSAMLDSFSGSAVRFSLMSFGESTRLHYSFNDGLSTDDLKGVVNGISPTSGESRVDVPLRDVVNVMFSDQNAGKRTNVPRVLVFLTSGRARFDPGLLSRSSSGLRAANIQSFVTVVGEGLEKDIQQVVTDNSDMFPLTTYGELSLIVTPMAQHISRRITSKYHAVFILFYHVRLLIGPRL